MDPFEDEIKALRRDKDIFFKTDLDSPLQPEQRSSFKDLNYYPFERSHRVIAKLDMFDHPEPVIIATSTGVPQSYLKYGKLSFEIKGTMLQLTVYKSAEDPFALSLFVPFSDATSGSETYGSGRHLDIEEQGTSTNWTSTWHTILTVHITTSTLVQYPQEKINYPFVFSLERRTTGRDQEK